jgi:glycosyltransferase involved in cell wall biosynthesis
VDDGSTDNTPEVVASYGDRIESVHTPHAGLSAARNAGLMRARGDWIAFHDADDVALPHRFTFLQGFLRRAAGFDAVFANR